MARTIEQINEDIEKLKAEKAELLEGHIKDLKLKAVNILTELHELDALPVSITKAIEAKDGTVNLRRTFAIRG